MKDFKTLRRCFDLQMIMVITMMMIVVVSGSLVQIALTPLRRHETLRSDSREKVKRGTAKRHVYHLF